MVTSTSIHTSHPPPPADFLVFLLAALQLRYFTRNPVEQGSPEQVNGVIVNFYKLNYWVDYIKVSLAAHVLHRNAVCTVAHFIDIGEEKRAVI